MTAPIPKTVAGEIHKELQTRLLTIPRYLEEGDSLYIQNMDELQKGLFATRVESLLAMATLAHMTGDIDHAERFMARAETAGASAVDVTAQRVAMNQNLGYASRALGLCEQAIRGPKIVFSFGLPVLPGVGGFSLLRLALETAEAAKIDLRRVDQIEDIRFMAQATAALPFTDQQYAAVLDLAGEILRARKLFWLDSAPRMFFDEEMQCAGIRYRVAVPPEEAAVMESELVRAIVGNNLDDVPITVGFIGVLGDDGLVEDAHAH